MSTVVNKSQLVKLYRQALEQGVPLDHLDEKVNSFLARGDIGQRVDAQQNTQREKRIQAQQPLVVKVFAWLIPITFIGVGLVLLGNVFVPIGVQLAKSTPDWENGRLIAPIPDEQVLDIMPLVIAQASTDKSGDTYYEGPRILDVELDYTNLSNWFSSPTPELEKNSAAETTYSLEIPKLRIEQAKVEAGGTDLNKSLIQYPGTAGPGELGAPVIFGHSVLRQFYNPSVKNPNRYNSIFSTIMTLQKGDEIKLVSSNATYRYVVIEKTEVKPEDTYILIQRRDARLLKLVTCTPEGTYLRRGVVTAQLVDNQ